MRRLAQAHLDTHTLGGAGDRTSNLLGTRSNPLYLLNVCRPKSLTPFAHHRHAKGETNKREKKLLCDHTQADEDPLERLVARCLQVKQRELVVGAVLRLVPYRLEQGGGAVELWTQDRGREG